MSRIKYKTVHSSDMVDEECYEDFHRKYYNTYFRIANMEDALVYLSEYVDSDMLSSNSTYDNGLDMYLTFINPEGEETKVLNTNDLVFDFSFPELGYVFMDNTAKYISLIPKHQYKRCYTDDIITSSNPDKVQQPGLVLVAARRQERARQIFNGAPFMSLKRAVSCIQQGEFVAYPIDKEWAIGAIPRIQGILVYYKTLPIGILDEKELTVELLPHTALFEDAILRHPILNLY